MKETMKKMGPFLSVVASVLAATGMLQASQTDLGGGGESARWVNIPTSPKAVALGGGFAAMGGDLDSLRSNAAGLGSLSGAQATFSHGILAESTSLEHVAAGMKVGNDTGIALAYDYINMGSVDVFTLTGGVPVSAGTLTPYGSNISLGVGRSFGMGLSAGVTGKYLLQNLSGSSSSAISADFGAQWASEMGLSAGISINNLVGQQLESNPLPSDLNLGLGYKLADQPVLLGLDASIDRANGDSSRSRIHGGVEYSPIAALALRGGYAANGANQESGPTFGVGLKYGWASFDYSMNMSSRLANTQQFSLTANLSDIHMPAKKEKAEAAVMESPKAAPVAEVKPVEEAKPAAAVESKTTTETNITTTTTTETKPVVKAKKKAKKKKKKATPTPVPTEEVK
jgi:hypothetical protein